MVSGKKTEISVEKNIRSTCLKSIIKTERHCAKNSSKLTRKEPGQMCETKFIILTSFQSFNLSFPLLSHVVSTAILNFPLWFPASPPWFLTFLVFSPRFLAFPRWFYSLPFPSHSFNSPHFPYSVLQFPILAFYR